MASTPMPKLVFEDGCLDCGRRQIELPAPLLPLGDDFDWLVRDYDGFRLFMLEELAARFSERSRWNPADMEVVIVEALAVVLDQLSDMLDRVHAEAFLQTARQPRSVIRLLSMIGYDAVQEAGYLGLDDPQVRTARTRELERLWHERPELMEHAREAGPRSIHTQERMVTLEDYALRLQEHPLVQRASAYTGWSGSWTTISVAVLLEGNHLLDEPIDAAKLGGVEALEALQTEIARFNLSRGLPEPEWLDTPSSRAILARFVERYRMVAQEVHLLDAALVGISISLSIRVAANYFQSEVRDSVLAALGTGVGGFFEPGNLDFGQDLYASDIVETVMALAGVEAVCINRFKRVASHYPDQSVSGHIELQGLEVAVCENRPDAPVRGSLRVVLHGGGLG